MRSNAEDDSLYNSPSSSSPSGVAVCVNLLSCRDLTRLVFPDETARTHSSSLSVRTIHPAAPPYDSRFLPPHSISDPSTSSPSFSPSKFLALLSHAVRTLARLQTSIDPLASAVCGAGGIVVLTSTHSLTLGERGCRGGDLCLPECTSSFWCASVGVPLKIDKGERTGESRTRNETNDRNDQDRSNYSDQTRSNYSDQTRSNYSDQDPSNPPDHDPADSSDPSDQPLDYGATSPVHSLKHYFRALYDAHAATERCCTLTLTLEGGSDHVTRQRNSTLDERDNAHRQRDSTNHERDDAYHEGDSRRLQSQLTSLPSFGTARVKCKLRDHTYVCKATLSVGGDHEGNTILYTSAHENGVVSSSNVLSNSPLPPPLCIHKTIRAVFADADDSTDVSAHVHHLVPLLDAAIDAALAEWFEDVPKCSPLVARALQREWERGREKERRREETRRREGEETAPAKEQAQSVPSYFPPLAVHKANGKGGGARNSGRVNAQASGPSSAFPAPPAPPQHQQVQTQHQQVQTPHQQVHLQHQPQYPPQQPQYPPQQPQYVPAPPLTSILKKKSAYEVDSIPLPNPPPRPSLSFAKRRLRLKSPLRKRRRSKDIRTPTPSQTRPRAVRFDMVASTIHYIDYEDDSNQPYDSDPNQPYYDHSGPLDDNQDEDEEEGGEDSQRSTFQSQPPPSYTSAHTLPKQASSQLLQQQPHYVSTPYLHVQTQQSPLSTAPTQVATLSTLPTLPTLPSIPTTPTPSIPSIPTTSFIPSIPIPSTPPAPVSSLQLPSSSLPSFSSVSKPAPNPNSLPPTRSAQVHLQQSYPSSLQSPPPASSLQKPLQPPLPPTVAVPKAAIRAKETDLNKRHR